MGAKRGRRESLPPPSNDSGRSAAPKWIWFRASRESRPKALEEVQALSKPGQAGLSLRIQRYLAGESRYQDVDSLGNGMLELRHRVGNNHFRVIFMRWGDDCVALTAFYKNQQQTPQVDLDRARRRAGAWVEHFGVKPGG